MYRKWKLKELEWFSAGFQRARTSSAFFEGKGFGGRL
jgi:hypothetical protein